VNRSIGVLTELPNNQIQLTQNRYAFFGQLILAVRLIDKVGPDDEIETTKR